MFHFHFHSHFHSHFYSHFHYDQDYDCDYDDYYYFVMIIIMIMIIITIRIIKMETIFMNTENSKTNESHRFRLDLTDKLNLKNPKKIWL